MTGFVVGVVVVVVVPTSVDGESFLPCEERVNIFIPSLINNQVVSLLPEYRLPLIWMVGGREDDGSRFRGRCTNVMQPNP